MPMLKYVPPPPLSAFVDCFWLHYGFDFSHARERCLPNGGTELIVHLWDDEVRVYDGQEPHLVQTLPHILLCGPHSNAFIIDTPCDAPVMGIHFHAGGAFPFLGIPAVEVHNQHLALEYLWGERIGELRQQLVDAPTPRRQFAILEQALLRHLRQPLERHPAVAFALRELTRAPLRPLADLTAQIGLSQRYFIQRFKDEVGLTPKLFQRVRRFQAVVHQISELDEVEWAEVALTNGYFDQAHFIHDFRHFSGMTPSAFLAHPRDRVNHVPLQE